MTREELIARWSQRAEDFERFAAIVDGRKVIAEMLTELELLFREDDSEGLTLQEAALESGYSADHLGREVRAGHIPNTGRPHAPRIRRADLPRKLGVLPLTQPENMFARRQIAQSVVTSNAKRNHDG
ncbi:MAG: hypothetical protein M3Z54_14655 [Gemmatimonadota bacterium]|nr:hypothetical protein [Gemmatimonadota bacterium]